MHVHAHVCGHMYIYVHGGMRVKLTQEMDVPALHSLGKLVRNHLRLDASARLSPVREGLVAPAMELLTRNKKQMITCVGPVISLTCLNVCE